MKRHLHLQKQLSKQCEKKIIKFFFLKVPVCRGLRLKMEQTCQSKTRPEKRNSKKQKTGSGGGRGEVVEHAPVLQNVVATTDMSAYGISLQCLAERSQNVEYNPKKFAAAIFRIKSPFSTFLILSMSNQSRAII